MYELKNDVCQNCGDDFIGGICPNCGEREDGNDYRVKKLQLYIGANNKTNTVEVTKMETILNKYFEGYNYISSTGYWQGTSEKSVNVLIATSEPIDKITDIVDELKTVLQQDSIMIDYDNNIKFI